MGDHRGHWEILKKGGADIGAMESLQGCRSKRQSRYVGDMDFQDLDASLNGRSAEAVDREECWAASAGMDIADAAEDVVRATWRREGYAGENAAYGCGVRAVWARGSWYARAHSSVCLDGVGTALVANIDGHDYQVSR